MKKVLLILLGSLIFSISFKLNAQTVIPIFDTILFYDQYAGVVDKPVPEGVIRLRNSLYTTKLSTEQLALFGNTIAMQVVIKAACDNYDRLGHVNLAFVPKGDTLYKPGNVKRIELGRFITPFMDKNKTPDTVPYIYEVDYLKHIFKEESLLQEYDYWIELEVSGVPYAANKEIEGCSGRNDVFYGTLQFITSSTPAEPESNNVLIPLFFQQNFNNYKEAATDELGETIKTTKFTLNDNLKNVKLVLVTSNHGANEGGEEYNRRGHYVYLDNVNVLSYRPGRASCEPFRVYNTQLNGIYGPTPRSNTEWQSFSNWCPGDVIDNRIINVGLLESGEHSFKIEVLNAVFAEKQGNIPLSLFLLGKIDDGVSINKTPKDVEYIQVFPNPVQKSFAVKSNQRIKKITLTNLKGQTLLENCFSTILNIENYKPGIYFIFVELENGNRYTQKLVKQ